MITEGSADESDSEEDTSASLRPSPLTAMDHEAIVDSRLDDIEARLINMEDEISALGQQMTLATELLQRLTGSNAVDTV